MTHHQQPPTIAMHGPNKARIDELVPVVYDELRAIAGRLLRREGAGHVLESAALVSEAYAKLIQDRRLSGEHRTSFLAAATVAMKRLLIDEARIRKAEKRGGGQRAVQLDSRCIAPEQAPVDSTFLMDAITELHQLDPLAGRIAEHFVIGGHTAEVIAELVQKSRRTVDGKLATARAFLQRAVSRR